MSRMFSIRDRDYQYLKEVSRREGESMVSVLSSAVNFHKSAEELRVRYKGQLGELGDMQQELLQNRALILKLQDELAMRAGIKGMRDTLASAAGLVSRAKEALDVVSKELRRGVEDENHKDIQ